jgi:hypothetical protein
MISRTTIAPIRSVGRTLRWSSSWYEPPKIPAFESDSTIESPKAAAMSAAAIKNGRRAPNDRDIACSSDARIGTLAP